MTREEYDRYVALFNARDYDRVLDHFAGTFELSFAGHVFRTRQEVRRFYGFLHAHVDERVTVHAFVSSATMVALEADVRLEGLRDMTAEDLRAQRLDGIVPLARGQVVTIPQFIHYHLRDGKIIRALCAVYEPPQAGSDAVASG